MTRTMAYHQGPALLLQQNEDNPSDNGNKTRSSATAERQRVSRQTKNDRNERD